MRACAECGQRLPRALPGAGRLLVYCTPACKQRAYRRRGGQASGTTGAQRARQARQAAAGKAGQYDQETRRTEARQDERSQQHPAPNNG
jgi:hypothetical protein